MAISCFGGSAVYFNPRSREGSDSKQDRGIIAVNISIHAPARGATICHHQLTPSCIISIHAPARGATATVVHHIYPADISIHAPARGATGVAYRYVARNLISIHAPARGATGSKLAGARVLPISIHAPARGATFHHVKIRRIPCDFNPRSREGSDYCRSDSFTEFSISIHAPARGATPSTTQR